MDAATSRASMEPHRRQASGPSLFRVKPLQIGEAGCARIRDEMEPANGENSGRTRPETRGLAPAGRGCRSYEWLDVGLRRCCHIWHAVMGWPRWWNPWLDHCALSAAAPSPIDTHNLTIWRAVDFGDWAPRPSGDLLFGDCSRGESMPTTLSAPCLSLLSASPYSCMVVASGGE